jgi:UDP-N-acetylglucosamine 2-epimerase (non-hydrolysing)
MDHVSFIQLLNKCIFVITDSGGLQEEVTFIGKPVLITRNTTERKEVMKAETGILVGVKSENIIKYYKMLLENPALLSTMSKVHFPYGDGYAAQHIVKILEQEFRESKI